MKVLTTFAPKKKKEETSFFSFLDSRLRRMQAVMSWRLAGGDERDEGEGWSGRWER